MRQQALRIVGDGIRHDVHSCAEQWCSEELPDRNVEALRSGLRDHIGIAQAQVRHFAQLLLSMPRCSTITPLGKPVEPEV
jgi:hypothetical protein